MLEVTRTLFKASQVEIVKGKHVVTPGADLRPLWG